MHTSVLLKECLTLLAPECEKALMIDSTLGEGGHSEAFLSQFQDIRIIGIDADPVIQLRARERLLPFGERMSFYEGWFDEFYEHYPYEDAGKRPDIILFDLGISVFHYEKSERGFSFRHDEALDMRLNPAVQDSAEVLINSLKEDALANLIYMFAEERYSRRIARAIVESRKNSRIVSTRSLADIVYRAVPADYRHGGIHPATKTFQALRIAVNGELERLPRSLQAAFDVLGEGGKMGVITFHSLEDRIVKNFFRDLAKNCICPPEQPICICGGVPRAQLLTKKALSASSEEIQYNSPSRSAHLRVIRKKICELPKRKEIDET